MSARGCILLLYSNRCRKSALNLGTSIKKGVGDLRLTSGKKSCVSMNASRPCVSTQSPVILNYTRLLMFLKALRTLSSLASRSGAILSSFATLPPLEE